MLSVLITAFREAATIGRAIEAFLPQLPQDAEVLVICPDPETITVVDAYAARYPVVRHVADPQRGKLIAVNIGLRAARGEIVVLSDGDIVVGADALPSLLAPFADPNVGAVSGHPLSINPRDTMLGYWSYVLTTGDHQVRLRRDQDGKFLVCSGHLLAFRRTLVQHLPDDTLAEDGTISHLVAQQGYHIRYAPRANVFVTYPSTYRGWLRHQIRATSSCAQENRLEIWHGTRLALRYPRHPREFLWILLLLAARLHLWSLIFVNVRLLRRPSTSLWRQVEKSR